MRQLVLVLICVISIGCRDSTAPSAGLSSDPKPQAAVKLTVLVVDDPGIAKGIELLAGEWNERSGGELAVTQLSLSELLSAEKLEADLVVYPSRHLGNLAMRNWLRPVRQSVLTDPSLAWGDLLLVLRDQTVAYGGEVFALPFGEMPLVMAWRGELPTNLPHTWQELGFRSPDADDISTGQFPLTAELLARTLARTAPTDRATLLFDTQTFDAKLKSPPLVQSLEEMLKSPATKEFSAHVCLPRDSQASRYSALPASRQLYNPSLDQWDSAETSSPPVICGFSGRLISVTSTSRNAASAFKLLPWLVGGNVGAGLSQRSTDTLWYRPSQVPQAEKWLGENHDEELPGLISDLLSRGEAYLLPRIPGIDRYLTEMESAIARVLRDQSSAAKTLAALETRWDFLTDELGREQQQTAFRKHLGLAD